MLKPLTLASLLALAATLQASPLAAQRLWVVAPTAGQGVDYTVIQDAVNAAGNGDMVLVRQGTYARFGIQAKALVVVGEGTVQLTPGTALVGLEIRDLAPMQSVVVRGLSMISTSSTPLSISNCQGPVTVEASTFYLSQPVSPFFVGAGIAGSSQVSLIDCRITTTGGIRGPVSALGVSGSTMHMYRCVASGGSTQAGLRFPGAVGAICFQSFLHASHCTFVGGNGDAGLNIGGLCLPPTDGGHALLLQDQNTVVYHANSVFQPGQPGQPGQGCPPAGNPGLPIAGSGTARAMAAPPNSFTAPALVRAGQTARLDFRGPAGFGVWLGLAPAQQPVFLAGCSGTFHLDFATTAIVFLGVMPGTGQLVVNVPIPPQLGTPGVELFLQAVFTDVTAGCVLGSPSAMSMVDSRY
jgi:hypothetical protein